MASVPEALERLMAPCWERMKRTQGSHRRVGFKPLQAYLLKGLDGWLEEGLQLGQTHETVPLYLLLRTALVWMLCDVLTLAVGPCAGGAPGHGLLCRENLFSESM